MTEPNVSYEIALSLIEAGRWRVDHMTGQVFGVQGNAFRRTNTDGYIQIKFRDPDNWRKERFVLAHRVVWETHHGPLGVGLEINHKDGCKQHNALANLEAVTHLANVRHALDIGLTPAMRGERNGHCILTADQALEVYRRAWLSEDQQCIGRDYGVTREAVSSIKQGHSWAHTTGHVRAA